jgi:hypothetical protein
MALLLLMTLASFLQAAVPDAAHAAPHQGASHVVSHEHQLASNLSRL